MVPIYGTQYCSSCGYRVGGLRGSKSVFCPNCRVGFEKIVVCVGINPIFPDQREKTLKDFASKARRTCRHAKCKTSYYHQDSWEKAEEFRTISEVNCEFHSTQDGFFSGCIGGENCRDFES